MSRLESGPGPMRFPGPDLVSGGSVGPLDRWTDHARSVVPQLEGSTMTLSDSVDLLLLPLDPARGLRRIGAELDRVSASDEKVRDARVRLTDRFGAVPSEQLDYILGPLLWLHLRPILINPGLVGVIIASLTEPATVREASDEALATTFNPRVLQQVIQEVAAGEELRSANGGPLQVARDEWRVLVDDLSGRLDVAPLIAAGLFAAGVLAGALAMELYHHHHEAPAPHHE